MSTQTENPASAPRRRNRRWVVIGIMLILIIVVALVYWLLTRGWVSTDDAQVTGDLVPINPRVAGYVAGIYVDDNEEVRRGSLLVLLDRKDLSVKLQRSEADLALQRAQARAAATQVSVTKRTSVAGERQAGASVSAAQANLAVADSQIRSAESQAAAARNNAVTADAAVASARANVSTARAEVQSAQSALAAAEADVKSATAQEQKASSDLARYEFIYRRGAVSALELDAARAASTSGYAALKAAGDRVNISVSAVGQSESRLASVEADLRQAVARAAAAHNVAAQARTGVQTARRVYSQAEAQLAAARAAESGAMVAPQQISISRSQSKAAYARIRQSGSDVRSNELQLSYTRIAAPVSGVVGQKSVEPGQYVAPGQMLMSVVPLSTTWVVANFKETELGRMKPGQEARMTVDAYPGREFYGKVQSIGPATGAQFSVLPPENATGNFVKVVQRIPVKIILNEPRPKGAVFRPGMNVVVRVRVSE